MSSRLKVFQLRSVASERLDALLRSVATGGVSASSLDASVDQLRRSGGHLQPQTQECIATAIRLTAA